jgi:hypothetical protein
VFGQDEAPRFFGVLEEETMCHGKDDVVPLHIYFESSEKTLYRMYFGLSADAGLYVGEVTRGTGLSGVCLENLETQDGQRLVVIRECGLAATLAPGRAHLGVVPIQIGRDREDKEVLSVRVGNVQGEARHAEVFFRLAQGVVSDPIPIVSTEVVVLVKRRTFVRGDSNQDGSVDISDAVFIIYRLYTYSGLFDCPNAVDSNDDNQTDLSDAIYILQYLFVGGPQMPHPFPAPGYDRNATSTENTGCAGL